MQPGTDIDLFISTEKIMVLNTDLQRISDTDVRQVRMAGISMTELDYRREIRSGNEDGVKREGIMSVGRR